MTPERFTDWLQGFVEIPNTDSISDTQWLIIKDHLKLVFDKKTPDHSPAFEIKPTFLDYKLLSDLIGKKAEDTYWKWPNQPPVITC